MNFNYEHAERLKLKDIKRLYHENTKPRKTYYDLNEREINFTLILKTEVIWYLCPQTYKGPRLHLIYCSAILKL